VSFKIEVELTQYTVEPVGRFGRIQKQAHLYHKDRKWALTFASCTLEVPTFPLQDSKNQTPIISTRNNKAYLLLNFFQSKDTKIIIKTKYIE